MKITLEFDKGFTKTVTHDNAAVAVHEAIKTASSRLGDSTVVMVSVEIGWNSRPEVS
ncbi:MAG: hypothetical protein ACRDGA_07870 [Bacteroidota bacterium]